jgi:exonuclease III
MTNVSNRSLSLLSWNVRGLGDPEKCSIVRDAIQSASPSVMCIQESKLHELNSFKTKTFLPLQLAQSLKMVPPIGSRGG